MKLVRIVVLRTDNTTQFHRWVHCNPDNLRAMARRLDILRGRAGVSKAWIRVRELSYAFR
jgi:hypothetical protein